MRCIRRLLADERVRFVVVGGVNTVVGYGLFVVFQLLLGRYIGYLGSLYASYALATVLAFVLHRRFTFRAHGSGNGFVEFLRFESVYVVSLVSNTVLLAVLVEWARWSPYIAQAAIVVVTTVLSYIGHKWFSFRPAKTPDPSAVRAGADGDHVAGN